MSVCQIYQRHAVETTLSCVFSHESLSDHSFKACSDAVGGSWKSTDIDFFSLFWWMWVYARVVDVFWQKQFVRIDLSQIFTTATDGNCLHVKSDWESQAEKWMKEPLRISECPIKRIFLPGAWTQHFTNRGEREGVTTKKTCFLYFF